MRTVLDKLVTPLLELLFPRRCSGCRESWLLTQQGYWCPECLGRMPWVREPLCPRCGRPYPDSPTAPDHWCGECLQGVFHFDWARSAVLYRGEVRERIHQLKFSRQLYQVPMMVDLLARAVAQGTDWPAFELIVPVPLHSRRLQQRGFNQAGLIARKLGPKLGLPVHLGVLVRRRWTEPQTRLGRTERLHNVKGAFAVTKAAVVRERCVLLVDDVYTTGTTLSEGARVLKAAGAGMVGALTIARALPDALSEPQ